MDKIPFINAKDITKCYRGKQVLSDISFSLSSGQVLGLLGHNGAGKSTLIKVLLGMHSCGGELSIFGLSPEKHRAKIVERLAYISDVAALPGWMTVRQLIKYTEGVHCRFDANKMLAYLSQTNINVKSKINTLSKGMKVQLHLALVMATDVNVLILDEPTLGLDLMYRSTFYRTLIDWFKQGERALIIASHEVDEIAHLVTDVLLIKKGVSILQAPVSQLLSDFSVVTINENKVDLVRALEPWVINKSAEQYRLLISNTKPEILASFDNVSQPSLGDIFMAKQQEIRL